MLQNRNSIMRGASGALGNELVFRQRAGKTVICLPPVPRPDNPTESQQEVRTRFQEAATYAKLATANPATRSLYEAKANGGRSPYNIALADYFKSPVIPGAEAPDFTGSPGDLLRIVATDDFKVQSVYVTITDGLGNMLEEGLATSTDTDVWTYTLMNAQPDAAKATIRASDLPGNQTVHELEL